MTTEAPTVEAPTYKDEDLVYVDVDNKKVVGFVEWDKNGNAKKVAVPEPTEEEAAKKGFRKRGDKRFFPWGTYKSMKRVYQLEGKQKRSENGKTLEEILPKALEQAFWND